MEIKNIRSVSRRRLEIVDIEDKKWIKVEERGNSQSYMSGLPTF